MWESGLLGFLNITVQEAGKWNLVLQLWESGAGGEGAKEA